MSDAESEKQKNDALLENQGMEGSGCQRRESGGRTPSKPFPICPVCNKEIRSRSMNIVHVHIDKCLMQQDASLYSEKGGTHTQSMDGEGASLNTDVKSGSSDENGMQNQTVDLSSIRGEQKNGECTSSDVY